MLSKKKNNVVVGLGSSGFDWMEEDLNVSLKYTERKGQGLYVN